MSYVEITKKIVVEIPGCSRCTMKRDAEVQALQEIPAREPEHVFDEPLPEMPKITFAYGPVRITMDPTDEKDEEPSFGWRQDGRHYWSGIVVFPCGHSESFLDEVRKALA